jgi:hypothetical protein
MWIGFAYIASNDKPTYRVWEVEPVEHNGQTLYRNVETGSVQAFYAVQGERMCETREEAHEWCAKRLEAIAADCISQVALARATAMGLKPAAA